MLRREENRKQTYVDYLTDQNQIDPDLKSL